MVSRRELFGLGATAGTVALLGGCAPLAARLRTRASKSDFILPSGSTSPAVRLFGRAGFGHRPGDIQAYARDGHSETVKRLLRADQPEDPTLTAQIMRLDAFRMDSVELEDFHREEIVRQLQQAAILRAVYGANPLKERMVDFWTNHFNIYGEKELGAFRKGGDEESVLRSHALGSFPNMLRASAKSPAMLGYLDNERNRKGAANENYARELMELHTLGVDGGYTQRDIQEVARCFTGWTVEDRFMHRKGSFRFDSDRHDDGSKTVLGHSISAGGGQQDAETVLDILARHPSTAKFLAKKMAIYFLGRRSEALEPLIAERYLSSSGNIPSMLRPILNSREFREGPPVLKRPVDLVASALRALDGTTDGGTPLLNQLATMGQSAYEWPMPDGYPVKMTAWSGSMLPRWNFAFALANGEISGSRLEANDLSHTDRVAALFGRPISEKDRELMTSVQQDGIGMAIAAPEYQWR